MKVKYNKPKGQRLKGQFCGLEIEWTPETPGKLRVWCYGNKYGELNRRWLKDEVIPLNYPVDYGYVSSSWNEDIITVKSALRHLKKHEKSFIKGTKFTLHSIYKGYDVYITI